MKKVLVSGYIGFNNFGDEAIFYALSTHLKSLGCEVSVLCKNKKEVRKNYQVKAYNFKDFFQVIEALLSCDTLISGGGSLLQNKTINFSLIYYLLIILLVKIFLKKTIIFAQGIEKINGAFFEFITKLVLKTCNFICVRDENSKEYLEDLNIDSLLVSDPVYSLVQDDEIIQNKDGLVVQLRDFKNLNKGFVVDLAKAISKNYQGNIKVFSFQKEYDDEICLSFIEELKKNNLEAEFISQQNIEDTIKIIKSAKYVISTRLHGLILSSAVQSKTFALIYDEKIRTLSNELNLENIDLYNYSFDEINEKINKFFNENQEIRYNYRRFCWECIDVSLGVN